MAVQMLLQALQTQVQLEVAEIRLFMKFPPALMGDPVWSKRRQAFEERTMSLLDPLYKHAQSILQQGLWLRLVLLWIDAIWSYSPMALVHLACA